MNLQNLTFDYVEEPRMLLYPIPISDEIVLLMAAL